MPLETGDYIADLVITNPDGSADNASTADDHLRLIKKCVKQTFPNLTAAVTATAAQIESAALYGVRTNAAASISATQYFVAAPRVIRGGVDYELGGVMGASWDDAGTLLTPAIGGWGCTKVSTGTYKITHPLNLSPVSDRLGCVATAASNGSAAVLDATDTVAYVVVKTYSLTSGSLQDSYGTVVFAPY